MATPSTPKKIKDIDERIAKWTRQACQLWDIALPIQRQFISPQKRTQGLSSKEEECVDEIIQHIRFLCCKDELKIQSSLERYEREGQVHYSSWIKKPKAERGVFPKITRQRPRPISQDERYFLLGTLRGLLRKAREEYRLMATASPSVVCAERLKAAFGVVSEHHHMQKGQDMGLMSQSTTRAPSSQTVMPPPGRMTFKANHQRTQRPHGEISFGSETDISSVWDERMPATSSLSRSRDYFLSSQDTTPDERDPSMENHGKSYLSQEAEPPSSEYFGSSPEVKAVADTTLPTNEGLSRGLLSSSIQDRPSTEIDGTTAKVAKSLRGVFPDTPRWLRLFPFAHRHEITRIFLHTSTPLPDIGFVYKDRFKEYDCFWNYLRSLELLKGKCFPMRSNMEAWVSALRGDYVWGCRGVLLSGTLRFNSSPRPDKLFQLQLCPLRLESSHRLGRKFGNDRFLELELPDLTHQQRPQLLKDVGDASVPYLAHWLVSSAHHILGRDWKPFLVKHVNRRDRKADESGTAFMNRVYFFAVASDFTISKLLNAIRPTRKNGWQPYLKLFARSSLAVSRNSETVTLEREKMIDKDDITLSFEYQLDDGTTESRAEIMTDGAGRISPALARRVVAKLGYNYLPSGFQARIGEAKGFWQVDHHDRSEKEWIEIYKSQRKWTRSTRADGESADASHRTFEFLPLLVACAREPVAMRNSIAELLKAALIREVEILEEAMRHPQSLRKWTRDSNPSSKDKLKDGIVTHRAGLPVRMEEIINFLLDAGFHPRQQSFLHKRAWSLITSECNNLVSKMKLTVDKSTYAYIVPDFFGVLKADEVYLDFSAFLEATSGFASEPLHDLHVLVARAPAHFPTDIQRVRAVFKAELMGLKDVIVFPTKGHPSLAAKLSGGDYDGDIAWICWDQSIVTNFVNAKASKAHDLVAEGFLRKDCTTYDGLVAGKTDETIFFLSKSFEFNLQPSLLGTCTILKEKLCYTLNTVDTPEILLLSTLLSNLVDQTKQGYTFSREDWSKMQKIAVKTPLLEIGGKTTADSPQADNIVDYLRFVAKKTMDDALEKLNEVLPEPSSWDEDLVRCYKRASCEAAPGWTKLVLELKADLALIRGEWQRKMEGPKAKVSPFFMANLLKIYEQYQAIMPHDDTELTQALLLCSGNDHNMESSVWAQLRASTLFASYDKRNVGSCVWWIAGRQLAVMKSQANGGTVPFVPPMAVIMKPDAKIVQQIIRQADLDPILPATAWDLQSVSDVIDLE